jgi:hypothetical protein
MASEKKIWTKAEMIAASGNGSGVSIQRIDDTPQTDYRVFVGGKLAGVALRLPVGFGFDQTGKTYPTMSALKSDMGK